MRKDLLLFNLAFLPLFVAAWASLGAWETLCWVVALAYLDWRILHKTKGG